MIEKYDKFYSDLALKSYLKAAIIEQAQIKKWGDSTLVSKVLEDYKNTVNKIKSLMSSGDFQKWDNENSQFKSKLERIEQLIKFENDASKKREIEQKKSKEREDRKDYIYIIGAVVGVIIFLIPPVFDFHGFDYIMDFYLGTYGVAALVFGFVLLANRFGLFD